MHTVKTPEILIADDDEAIGMVLTRAFEDAGYKVHLVKNLADLWKLVRQERGDVLITDVMMPDGSVFDFLPRFKNSRPDLPVIVISAQNTLLTAIKANELGAFDYIPKPFDLNELLKLAKRGVAHRQSMVQNPREDAKNSPQEIGDGMPLIGRSAAMQEVYRVLARMMQNDLTLLVSGESGTGKEVVARTLHEFGTRSKGPFVAINMAAIPKDLIESELFGHEKGAFTGAVQRSPGQFANADGGTLFLDEIGDMPLEAQTRLLRVLQQGEFTSVGGRTPTKTDVRIIAATNKNLSQSIANGEFREDLFYRLNVVPLRIPSLRERKEDIPVLVDHFVSKYTDGDTAPYGFDQDAIKLLQTHHWPGNVRELENLVRRLLILYKQETINVELIAQELKTLKEPAGANPESFDTLETAARSYFEKMIPSESDGDEHAPYYQHYLPEFERPLIQRVLQVTSNNQVRAAQILGLNRNTLRKKIKHLKISLPGR